MASREEPSSQTSAAHRRQASLECLTQCAPEAVSPRHSAAYDKLKRQDDMGGADLVSAKSSHGPLGGMQRGPGSLYSMVHSGIVLFLTGLVGALDAATSALKSLFTGSSSKAKGHVKAM
mmetsp:Transcript_8665/g.14950  ORF Transcript_8665/g.14950 Transcript_8665/m.14950 type:complete len:119 (+) Transcript_8665:82-438(+)|eukprot:CAMPEP_0119101330 /NCGR_PEP_ID=MMETSP1180-20130426/411_1 /TAXON_ID=3052 ORGANISM="Chlamydomonas cf sp, Strain CCMP681" /NCGR_SAMPLE_ID=MMETSP1180 /ASSEMBLY_ACC=CAM_ASM_000741 /LENGTH=118 /DNA_ID=CAMNT_0007085439 /DNA_START=80 /DNA_END=436 /DNA_ORIENTATION=+